MNYDDNYIHKYYAQYLSSNKCLVRLDKTRFLTSQLLKISGGNNPQFSPPYKKGGGWNTNLSKIAQKTARQEFARTST